MQFILSFILFTFMAHAAPVFVYVTQTKAPTYVTVNNGNMPPGEYSTDYANAQTYTTTLWPPSSTYATVLVSTQAPEAPENPPQTTPSPEPASPAPTTTSAPENPAPVTTSQASASPPPASTPVADTPKTTSPVSPATTTSSTEAQAPTSTVSSTPSSNALITAVPKYMVYTPFADDRSCKDASTIKQDLTLIKNKGIERIRIYATDCDSLNSVQPACKELGLRIVQGVWIGTLGVDHARNQLNDLIKNANGDWSIYDSIIVGNEDVANGYISGADLLSAVKEFRGTLQSNGYQGSVIIAETTEAYLGNADHLCDSSFPYIGLNAHSYFASSFAAEQAGEFVNTQKGLVSGVCGRSDIWISETGYPHKGDSNGLNIPTKENQAAAVNSLLETLNKDMVLLAQFDDLWKDPGKYGIEQYFGVIDSMN